MKSEGFSHFILTRYNTQDINGLLYDKPDPHKWMDSRIQYFEETKRSVLSQEGDFKWVISLDHRTPKKYLDKIFTDDRMIRVDCDIRDTFNEIEVDTPWVITSRLDNDDQYLPGFVESVQEAFEPTIKVIDVEFHKLDWGTGDLYRGERKWPSSMFISLVEPSSRILTAFCRPHGKVFSGYPTGGHWSTEWKGLVGINNVTINKKLALMVCHDSNVANQITEGREGLIT